MAYNTHPITNNRICYPQPGGLIAIVCPSGELSLEDTASQCVPAGEPYIILMDSDLPSDYTFRYAWEMDFSTPHGYGIGAEAWFALQGV